MKPKPFVALFIAAALSSAVAIAAYVTTRPWSATLEAHGAPMLPAVQQKADSIAGVEIEQGSQSLKLALENGKWVLAKHEGYPANIETVRKLVRSAVEASLLERKTAKPAGLKMLGLGDPKVMGSGARLMRFSDKSGAVIGEIIVGNAKGDAFGAGKGGSYVRLPGQDQAWLANRQLDGSVTLKDWVKTRVVDVSPQSIKTAEIKVAGDAPYKIVRDTDGRNHKLDEIPAGKKVKYANSLDDILESASFVDFKKVRKAGKADALPDAGSVDFETESGLKVTLNVRSDGKEAWVRVTAKGDGDAKSVAEALAGRVDGWEFEVPAGKVPGLLKKKADLLEDASS